MVLTSVLQQLRAAPAASDKTASFPARPWTAAVRQSAWILMGMPLPAASAAKHSCATTAEVKILHWGPSHVEMPTPVGKGLMIMFAPNWPPNGNARVRFVRFGLSHIVHNRNQAWHFVERHAA